LRKQPVYNQLKIAASLSFGRIDSKNINHKHMKASLNALLLIISTTLFAQSNEELNLLKLSGKIFSWEVESKFDSLENTLSDRLVVLNSAGGTQTKSEYVARLKSGDFVHNDIHVEQSAAVISGNTGTVTGKGMFKVTVNGKQSAMYLTYLEVFTRPSSRTEWKLLALHASIIPN
jgi:hypothetical protein